MTSTSISEAKKSSNELKNGTSYASIPNWDLSFTSIRATNSLSSFRLTISAWRFPIWPQPITANLTFRLSAVIILFVVLDYLLIHTPVPIRGISPGYARQIATGGHTHLPIPTDGQGYLLPKRTAQSFW